jgi:hypothetical protein
MKSVEVQLNEALEIINHHERTIVSLQEQLRQQQIAFARCERDGILKASRLPEPCVKRINDAFAKSIDNAGLKQAIHAEERYLERVR